MNLVACNCDFFVLTFSDGVCVQSIEHPGCVWDAKFMENGDIVTACSDGVVRIWTVNQDYFADQLELDLYTSQLSQYKSSRYAFCWRSYIHNALATHVSSASLLIYPYCEFLNHGFHSEKYCHSPL